jgi:hypothetical protein
MIFGKDESGAIVAVPILSGLHHHYIRIDFRKGQGLDAVPGSGAYRVGFEKPKTLPRRLGPYGIRANCIAPETILTPTKRKIGLSQTTVLGLLQALIEDES